MMIKKFRCISPLVLAAALLFTACGGSGGSSSSGSGGGSPPAILPPTGSVTANPTQITIGGSSTITITSTGATSCSGSGSWSGAKPCNGSVVVTPTTATTGTLTYGVTFQGPGGSVNASATVTVLAPPVCLNPGQGTGNDIPCITTVVTPYNGDCSKAQITATNQHNSDFLIETYWTGNSYSSPDADRYAYYDPTMATTHTGVITDLMCGGKTYVFNVATCSTGSGGGGSPPFNCKRTDPNYSIAPSGNGQSNGYQFTTATPTGSTFTWKTLAGGGPQYVYVGHTITQAISNQWLTGSASVAPSYLFVTSIMVDGQTCGQSGTGGTCGTTGISTQFTQDNSEVPSPGTNNLDSFIAQGGAYSGHYFCSNSPAVMNCFGIDKNFVLISPSLSATTCTNSCHSMMVTMQAADANQNNIGSPQSFTFNFSVLPAASFTVSTPGSYPAIPGFSNYYGYLASYGKSSGYGIQTAVQTINSEINLPGQYLNDNFSASMSVGPYGIWNYDGSRVAYGIADQLGTISATWSPGRYTLWTPLLADDYVFVATTAGATCGAAPTWDTAPGTQTSDCGVVWTNVGNSTWWNRVAERIHDQVRDWQLFHDHWTSDSEWNRFTDGDDMHCHRNYSSCTSSSLDTRAVEFFLFPFFSPSGGWAITNQRIEWNYFAPETDTLRDREYEIPALYNFWVMGGNAPIDNGINELTARIDATLSQAGQITQYSPWDGHPYTPACCMGFASFDVGLVSEALIHYWIVQNYESQTPDARIPIEVGKLLDWTYSNEFNLAGDYGLPYTAWLYPFGPQMYNYAQSDLDMLLAPAYAWYGAVNGGTTCTLPTSHANCWAVADLMFQKAFLNTYGGSKEFSQIYKWMDDYIGWRTGAIAGNDSTILPVHNTYLGSTTPNIEPYPQSEWAADVTVSNLGSTSATFSWYNTQSVTSMLVKCYTNSNLTGTPITATGGANSLVSGSDNFYFNQLAISGLGPSAMYFCAVGGSNSNGTALSAYDIIYSQGQTGQCYTSSGCSSGACNGDPNLYAVCTNASSGNQKRTSEQLGIGTTSLPNGELAANNSATLSADSDHHTATANSGFTVVNTPRITTISLPNGQSGSPYSASLSVSGGVAPFTWSAVSGAVPPGLSLTPSNGEILGTPNAPGTYTASFEVSDANNKTTRATVSITIIGNGTLTILTTSLPEGTAQVIYGASLEASGGVQPYNWSQMGGLLPPGLTLDSNGTIGGPPTTAGTYGLAVQVADSGSPQQKAHATLSITISPATLRITTAEISRGEVHTFYQTQLEATGGGTPFSWSLISGTLPAGLTLNNSGLISGTPTTPGLSNFTVEVKDSGNLHQTVTKQLSLTIDPVQTLTIPPPQLPDGTVNVAYQANVTATGGIPPYSWAASSLLPPKLILSLAGDIYGTPSEEGTYQIGLMVKDSANPPDTATVTLPLTVNRDPSLRITTVALPVATVGFRYQTTLGSTGGEPPVTWSITSGTLPAGLFLNQQTGVISGAPTATGVEDITFQAEDSQGTKATKSLTVGVLNPLQSATTTTVKP